MKAIRMRTAPATCRTSSTRGSGGLRSLELGDLAVALADVVPALEPAIADPRAEHQPGGVTGARELVDVLEVLEHLAHRAEDDRGRGLPLVRLEDRRRVEHDV